MIDVRVADKAIQMEKSRPSEPGMDKTAKEASQKVPTGRVIRELTSGNVGNRNPPENVVEAKSIHPPKPTRKAG